MRVTLCASPRIIKEHRSLHSARGAHEQRSQRRPRGRRRLDVGHLLHRRARGPAGLPRLRRQRPRRALLLRGGGLPPVARLAADAQGARRAREGALRHRDAEAPAGLIALLRALPKKTTPMEVLRTGVSALSAFDPDATDNSREATARKAVRLTAQMPTLVAAWERIRRGKPLVAPNPKLSLAANFLAMLRGGAPTPLEVKTFDVALMLHADHEFNASTFAARVTAATMSDLHSAITSAIGALKGPLHGGANEQVMRMVEQIGTPERAEGWIRKALADKARVMGFGHRVYRVEDPRAKHLRRLAMELGH